jgi:antitoxin MazE
MESIVRKWGNSLGVRIPKSLAETAGIKEDTPVEVSVSDEGITIKPTRQKHTLKELVSKITPDNRHDETNWGTPAGRELW